MLDKVCSVFTCHRNPLTLLVSPRSFDQALQAANLLPSTNEKWLWLLYKICGRHTLLPRALKVLVNYDRTSDALYHGGYADVWKGEFRGQDVAVKVIRTYSGAELQRVISVGDWLSSPSGHFVLTTLYAEDL